MAVRPSSVSRLQVSRALLAAVDQLATEFPQAALSEIYLAVGDARVAAARRLPNVAGYRDVLEREARCRLMMQTATGAAEMSAGTCEPGPILSPGGSEGG
jgi:hypothetical protein